MNKLSLNVETLAVTSFATTEARAETGANAIGIGGLCTGCVSTCGIIATL